LLRTLVFGHFPEITIDEIPYYVKGVFEDWPENSYLDVHEIFYSEVAAQNY